MKISCLFVFILVLAGCRAPQTGEAQNHELKKVDIAFSDLSQAKGMNHAFISYCADDAVLLRKNTMPIKGAVSIAESLLLSDDKAINLTWEPLHATVAESGDLGYTYGTYKLELKQTGEISRGTYVSIWKKENGAWKWVLDSGNEGLGPENSETNSDSGV